MSASASARVETGYAKINLALHVRRRRADGYHDIETVFAFCEDGDRVEAAEADELSLVVEGPFASDLGKKEEIDAQSGNPVAGAMDVSENLVLRAARALDVKASLHLTKNLPVASGIGGGSADAAATLRLLGKGRDLHAIAASLGADVPACLASVTARGDGTGTDLLPFDAGVAGVPVLLVNPRVALSTAAVFKAWDGVDRGPLDNWRLGRNDLEAPARALLPVIDDVLGWLKGCPGANLVRMSGSGATCFALFDSWRQCDMAAFGGMRDIPEWWWKASRLR